MANTSARFIIGAPPVNITGSGFIPVNVPASMPRCKKVVIRSLDASVDLTITTDSAGSPTVTDTIPHGTEREIKLEPGCNGWGANEVICYLKGGVSTQPIFWFYD